MRIIMERKTVKHLILKNKLYDLTAQSVKKNNEFFTVCVKQFYQKSFFKYF